VFSKLLTFFIFSMFQIVLNIHGKDDSSLEVHRINTLLAHGCCVISERGSDPLLTEKVQSLLHRRVNHMHCLIFLYDAV
jgi:hypothetical protein